MSQHTSLRASFAPHSRGELRYSIEEKQTCNGRCDLNPYSGTLLLLPVCETGRLLYEAWLSEIGHNLLERIKKTVLGWNLALPVRAAQKVLSLWATPAACPTQARVEAH